jgi:cell division protein FtsB
MQQRRTPSGQGPGGRSGRGNVGRDVRGAGRRSGARSVSRDPGVRAEPTRSGGARGGAPRATTPRAGTAGVPRTGVPDAARSANRPAAARRPSAGGAVKRTRAPQPRRLSGRAAVACMLLIGLLLAYAYPVRVYLSQQNEIDQLERSQAAQRQHIDELAGQLQKWDDDEYVKAQARGRLLFVLPGEKPLLVVDNAPKPGPAGTAAPPGQGDASPWYGKLWTSIRTADQGAH